MTDTYGTAAPVYIEAGWTNVLPLPHGQKFPPPSGFTGANGVEATPAQVSGWIAARADGNLAIRLPRNVIGIDVDDYGDKSGAATFAAREAEWGTLPTTVMTTSRGGGASGIRLYTIPTGLSWPNVVGEHIDVIRHGHRYAVAAPSVHPSGAAYRWITSDTRKPVEIPRVDSLPALPDAWVSGLSMGAAADKPVIRVTDVARFLGGLTDVGKASFIVGDSLADFETAVGKGVGRHGAMCDVQLALALAGAKGAIGVPSALAVAEARFYEAKGSDHETRSEWDRSLAGAVALIPGDLSEIPALAESLVFEVEGFLSGVAQESAFWTSRPELATIRTFARSRIASPWAVLGVVLTDVVSTVPPTFRLPPTIGGEGSLNLFVGLVGASGDGKGVAARIASEVLGFTPESIRYDVGSGEGLIRAYVDVTKAKGDDGHNAYVTYQHSDSARFRVNEIDTLAALSNRSGAIIMPMLRSAYSGESLGFQNADALKRVRVDDDAYRFTLVAGIQPARAGWLLEDADGGTPQRFVWLPATDASAPDNEPETPDPLKWKPITYGSFVRQMKIPDIARKTIVDARKARNRGQGDALDGHSLYTRLKVAAALATLARRFNMTEEDWRLAGVVMTVSDRARTECESEIRKVSASNGKKAAQARGVGDVIAAGVRETAIEKRVTANLKARLEKAADWVPRKDLARSLRSDQRDYLEPALDTLIMAGAIEEKATVRGGRQARLFRRAG